MKYMVNRTNEYIVNRLMSTLPQIDEYIFDKLMNYIYYSQIDGYIFNKSFINDTYF